MSSLTAVVWRQECRGKGSLHVFNLSTYEQQVCHDAPHLNRCGCKGFQFRGQCKHLTEALSKVCNWTETESEEKQSPQQEMEAVCPRCWGPTRSVKEGD